MNDPKDVRCVTVETCWDEDTGEWTCPDQDNLNVQQWMETCFDNSMSAAMFADQARESWDSDLIDVVIWQPVFDGTGVEMANGLKFEPEFDDESFLDDEELEGWAELPHAISRYLNDMSSFAVNLKGFIH